MSREGYRVDYHVVGTIYLDRGHEISGPDFAKLWSKTTKFGKHKCAGGFWHEGTAPGGQRNVVLGSLDDVNPLLERGGPKPVFGGGTYAKLKLARGSTLDCDFYFEHTQASRCFGGDTLPHFLMTVSGQWFENTGVEVVLEMFREQFEIADKYCPRYGLIDVSAANDCYAGMVYGSTFFLNSPLHRWAEQANWVHSGSKRKDKVRGVYWGNYFGPELLRKLGGRDRFLKRVRHEARQPDGNIDARIWEFPNGVFVSLGFNPLDCRPGLPLGAPIFPWLVCELGIHGTLDAWSRWANVPFREEGPVESEHFAVVFPKLEQRRDLLETDMGNLDLRDIEWIKGRIAQARQMALPFCETHDKIQFDPKLLDAVHAKWLQEWHEGAADADPNSAIGAIGAAFGQWLVDSLGLRWQKVKDSSSDGMGIRYDSDMTPLLVFPTQVFAKRLPTGETDILQALCYSILRPAAMRDRK